MGDTYLLFYHNALAQGGDVELKGEKLSLSGKIPTHVSFDRVSSKNS